MIRHLPVFLLAYISLAVPCSAAAPGLKILADTTWAGEVVIEEDVLVIEGATLIIAPGTTINVLEAESTKTEPEYLSPLSEITIRGSLIIEGTPDKPVTFDSPGGDKSWAGILVDGGRAIIRHATLSSAETALYCMDCTLDAREVRVSRNAFGLIIQGSAATADLGSVSIIDNKFGIALYDSPKVSMSDVMLWNNEVDTHESSALQAVDLGEYAFNSTVPEGSEQTIISEETTLLSDTVWRGRVVLKNVVRVPPDVKLVIMPGTVVEFSFRDSNGDGIGENGIWAQGAVWARGTRERPVVFTSPVKKKGAWDAINFMASDATQNLIENCVIEYAFRGLHSHFSLIGIRGNLFRNNMRAMQFQFSELDIRDNVIVENTSGLQFRDSKVTMNGNLVAANRTGINFLMSEVKLHENRVSNNSVEGVRIRESVVEVNDNSISANRRGVMMLGSEGDVSENVIEKSYEDGINIKNSKVVVGGNDISGNGLDGASVDGLAGSLTRNVIAGNGGDGLSIKDMSGDVEGNAVTGNGGNGISLKGMEGEIHRNSISSNAGFNIDLSTGYEVDARHNWWGSTSPDKIELGIYDGSDEPGRGRVIYQPYLDDADGIIFAKERADR